MDKKLTAIMTSAALAAMFGSAAVYSEGAGYGGSAGADYGSGAGDSAATGMGTTGQTAGADFSNLDTNQDGYISQDEAQAHQQLSSNWQDADRNADNQIDQSEFSAFEGAPTHDAPVGAADSATGMGGDTGMAAGADFSSLDVNQDGYLSQDEAAGDPRLANNWQAADTDADGRVSEPEFSAFEAQAPDMETPTQPGVGTDSDMGTTNGGTGMDSGGGMGGGGM